jgi:hypothetical protein
MCACRLRPGPSTAQERCPDNCQPTRATRTHAWKLQVGRLAVNERLQVLAPPKQEEDGGAVRAEGQAVKGPGKVGRCWAGDGCPSSCAGSLRRTIA